MSRQFLSRELGASTVGRDSLTTQFVIRKCFGFAGATSLLVLLTVSPVTTGAASSNVELAEVRKIWERAPHNAFTDLARFKGKWFCVFREGAAHVSPDGALRVITSKDGKDWVS